MAMVDAHPHVAGHPTDRLVGTTPAVAALRAQICHLAPFDTLGNPHVPTVLLQGETGTGKGLVARVIHDSGPRAVGPFLEVNCAAIPETMLEAELFGFEPGAFTDAKRAKPGLFEAASGGTLFLDEIDALPLGLQGKLLTALESKQVRRLGAVVERGVDVKLMAATNAALPEAVAGGRFRADLYHRLAVVVLVLPPLRERGADVCALARAYLQRYTTAHRVPPKRLSAEAEAWLQGHAWPGNVRELSHVMERVTLLHVGEEVDTKTLTQLGLPLGAPATTAGVVSLSQELEPVSTEPAEAEQIRQALAQTGGNVVQAARVLGVSRDTVRYRMQRYGIARSRLGAPSPPAFPRSPGADTGGSLPPSDELPPEPTVLPTLPRAQEEAKDSRGAAARPDARHDTAMARNVPTSEPAWDHQPGAVLALELTWPTAPGVESLRYEPWTEMARWEQAIVDKVRGFGGMLVQRTASLFVWVFGVPQVLEQLPQRAVHSALAIRQMVVDASTPDLPPCPAVRLAVHLGTVRVDRQTADPAAQVGAVGETLALPMQLLGQAALGEIVVSPEVGRLVDGWVALEARQLRLRPGDPTRLGGYAVMGVSPGRGAWAGRRRPTRSPLAGRERELLLLDAILEQVKAGRGQVVSLVGAPGMGKSRLLDEFRQRLGGQDVRYAEAHCLAYGSGTPYLPILDLLREHCGIVAQDPPDTRIRQLRMSLEQVRLDAEASLPYLLDLLGLPIASDQFRNLSPEARKARTFETVRQLYLMSSQHHPLVLAVENLHWIDPTSEALLASLVDGLAGAAILLLATCRPGYRAPWLDKSYATQTALQPLGPDESRQVVRRVMRDTALPPALEQQLLARAEGNPFFLEELAYTVREYEEGHPSVAVPDTIQAVLAARMDRLPTPKRDLLQAAAVIGKDIAVPLLQAISELPEATLQQGLVHLQGAEFLYETQFFPERAYTFKHALTQEVAYGSLLPERRRALHARIVEALEALAGDRGAEPVERLAHHALRGEVWDKAVGYCRQAGEKALARSAHREAVGFFEQALGAVEHLPEGHDTSAQAIDLLHALRNALWPLGELGQIHICLQAALALAEALGDRHRLGWTAAYLAGHFGQIGESEQALAFGQRALVIAADLGDAGLTVTAQHYLGTVYRSQGDYPRAIAILRKNVAYLPGELLQERFRMQDLVSVSSRYSLAYCLAECGTFTEGIAPAEEGVRIAEAADHPYSRVLAYYGVGFRALRKGDLAQAIPMLERARDLAQGARIRLLVPLVAAPLGAAYVLAGRNAEALPLLEQGVAQAMAIGYMLDHALRLVWLGEAYLRAGRLDEAYNQAQRALEFSQAHQERSRAAYALQLLGQIAARRDPPEATQAEAYYRQALALADELGMRPLLAHCHRGLGMLYRGTGQQAQARTELLAAITLYRTMEMTFWLPETEGALARVQSYDART
jgi:DNA-binding NtrC family response regulator/tetratricopeptide (TPR) repeat protein